MTRTRAEFESGQPVEVNTAYLDTEPERWERATVYKTRTPGLSDRFIEVYTTGGVAAVMIERVRPDAAVQLTDDHVAMDKARDAVRTISAQLGPDLAKTMVWSYTFGYLVGEISRDTTSLDTVRLISRGLQQGIEAAL